MRTSRIVAVGAAAVATAALTTAAAWGLAAPGDAEPVAPFTGGGAPAVVTIGGAAVGGAVPRSDCPGSYLSTQDAGAAAPRVRPAG